MVEKTSAAAGGCWFCETDANHPWEFSWEFDAFFHVACAAAEGFDDADDPVLAFELAAHS